jgi:hypothetical protein
VYQTCRLVLSKVGRPDARLLLCQCLGQARRTPVGLETQKGVPMVAGYTPNQGYIAMRSQQLADADFTGTRQDTGEDHSAHADGKT